MKRKSLEFQKIKSKLQQRRKKDAAAPSPSSISTSTSSAPTSPGLGPTVVSRGNSSSNSSSNSGDELEAQQHHLRSPIRPQPPTTPELKMVVAGLEEGAVERKRKQVAEDRSKQPVADGSSSGGDGEEEEDDGDSESPSKKRKAGSTSTFAQTYTLRLEQAIRDCVNAIKMAEQRLGMPLPKSTNAAPIYYRWSSLARAKYIEPEWQFLSNMSPFPVTIDGIAYPTLEHYYHVMKFVHARTLPIKFDSVEQMRSNPVVAKILSMPDPEKVKQLMGKNGSMGKKLPFNGAAWSKAIPQLMMNAKLEKVRQHPGIRRLLLESGQRTIAERKLSHRKKTPPEPSDIRGMLVLYKGQWYGDNGSGKMWMRVRRQLQQEELERERIAERARTKGKLVLVESDNEETTRDNRHLEAEMQVVEEEEEIIEELIEDVDEDEDELEADGRSSTTTMGTVVITVPVGTKAQDYIISHVKDEHVTIAHNPEEDDLRAIREQQQQKQKLQQEREEEEEEKREEEERRRRRMQELEEERKRRRAQEVEEEERRRRRRAQQLKNESAIMKSRRGGAEEAAALLRVRRPYAEPQPQSQPRRASAPTTATTPSSFVPAEVFREAPTRRPSKAVEEEEVVEEEIIEEILEEEILEEEVVEFFEEVIEEDEVIEEAQVLVPATMPVVVTATRVVERDCFDMSDSDESDLESDSADDSDSDSSDDSSDDGY